MAEGIGYNVILVWPDCYVPGPALGRFPWVTPSLERGQLRVGDAGRAEGPAVPDSSAPAARVSSPGRAVSGVGAAAEQLPRCRSRGVSPGRAPTSCSGRFSCWGGGGVELLGQVGCVPRPSLLSHRGVTALGV